MSAIWPMSMPQLLEVTRNTSVRCSRPTTTASVGSSIPPAAPEHRSRRTPDVFGPDPAPFPLVESGSDELSPELVVTKLFEAVESAAHGYLGRVLASLRVARTSPNQAL
jgi:hypothetical protein